MSEPVFFKSQAEWRRWLARNHDKMTEIRVGLVKVGSGLAGITHRQALDEALCYGWIDGVAHSIDDMRWMIRFAPRRAKSYWSAINRKRAEELIAEGRMAEPGQAVFDRRDRDPKQLYSHESEGIAFSAAEEEHFRANRAAWTNFAAMPQSYRRPATWWVVSAKRADTRQRRLAALIEDSAAGRKIKPLRRRGDAGTDKGGEGR